jgi:hypothetical protein
MRPLRLYVHFKGRDVRRVELIHGLVKITKSAGDHRYPHDLHPQDQISISLWRESIKGSPGFRVKGRGRK